MDFLVDKGTSIIPIEVKSGKTLAADWFGSLNKWKARAGDIAETSVLIYGGDATYNRENIQVTSWKEVAGQLKIVCG